MRIFALLIYGILTALVMAAEGDFSGIKKIGEILVYMVLIGLIIWFLAETGWGGLFLLLIISLVVGGLINTND